MIDDGLTDDERAAMVQTFLAPPSEAAHRALAEHRRRRVDREAYARACEIPNAIERAQVREILRTRMDLGSSRGQA